MSHLLFLSQACLDCDLCGHDGSVLLSVVAQALLLYIYYLQVRIFPFSAMPMRAASGKSRLTRAGFHTGTHRRLEWPREAFSSWAKIMYLTRETNRFR
jgi:hypothetical protein